MNADCIDDALAQIDRLRKLIKKGNGTQMRGAEERAITKATGLSWFHNYKAALHAVDMTATFNRLDDSYQALVAHSDRLTTRKVYDQLLKSIRSDLISLRAELLAAPTHVIATSDQPVSFQALGSDARMQAVLAARWNECVLCLHAGAPLAATVMMGGLLEALLLARVNLEPNMASIFKASSAPKDNQQKAKPLKEWALKNYIEVAHELGWVTVSAKDVGEVLRDYRNYIHPSKQYSHNVTLTADDAIILWEVAKAIARQVLKLSTR
jgi:hypothetical protein